MKCKRFYSSRFNFGINDLCIYSSTALVIKSLKLLFVLLQMERQWMSSHLRCVGEVSSGGEKPSFSWRLRGGLNRNGSGGSQTLTQSNWREPERGSWRWKHCVTTASSLQNLTSSYCHHAPKKENGNSSSIGALEIWKWEMSKRRGDVAKAQPPAASPAVPMQRGRAQEHCMGCARWRDQGPGGEGTAIGCLPAPGTGMKNWVPVGWTLLPLQPSANRTPYSSILHQKKLVMHFSSIKIICIYFSAHGQAAPQLLTSEASEFCAATSMAGLPYVPYYLQPTCS